MKTVFIWYWVLFWSLEYSTVQAQGFNKSYDRFLAPNLVSSVIELSNNEFIILGIGTDSIGNSGIDLYKVNNSGNLIWWKFYVAPGIKKYYPGINNGLILLPDSTLMTFGSVLFPGGEQNFCLFRFDLNGDTLFTKEWGNPGWEFGAFCRLSPEGNLILAGESSTMGLYPKEDFYLAKCDLQGNLLWERNYDIGSRELIYKCEVASNGDVYLSGRTLKGSFSFSDTYLVKTDSSGNICWQKVIQFPQYPSLPSLVGGSVSLISDTEIIITHGCETGNGSFWPVIQKFDSSGVLLWENASMIFDMPNLYRQVHKGNGDTLIYIGLRISDEPSQAFQHLHIVRGDTAGNLFDRRIYYKTDSFGLGANSDIFSSQMTSDGGLILGGHTQYYSYDHWALRLDASGCVVPNDCGETPLVEMQVLEPEGKPGSIYPNPVKDVLTWKAPFPVSNNISSTNSYSPLLVVDRGGTVLNVRDEPTFRRSIIPPPERIAPYYTYTLMDYQGRVLLTGQWELEDSGRYSVDVSSFSSGCYFLLINSDAGYLKGEKWIKE